MAQNGSPYRLVLVGLRPLKSTRRESAEPAPDDPNSGGRGPIRGARPKWLFRAAALLLPLVLLLLLEAALRVFGYGYSTDFFRKISTAEGEFLVENDRFARRYFPPGLARTPTPFKIPARKSANTFRIFILGESAAMGDPDPSFGFGRVLQVLLEDRFPGQTFEVVNVAVTAINSHVVREIARDCRAAGGDLWIVYMGNNEVVGPFGAGTVFGSQTPSLTAIRAQKAFKKFRVGQLLGAMTSRLGKSAPDSWGGMEMFLHQQVRADDPRMQKVYAHFEKNLREIIREGTDGGVKVLVASVVANLRGCPPFASLHKPSLAADQLATWQALYQRAMTNEAAGNWADAAASYEAAAAVDGSYAELWFRLAQCRWNLAQFDEARAAYLKARDLDTLRFRVDGVLNKLVEKATTEPAREGVRFVDLEAVAGQSSPRGVTGNELLFEHVHLNFAGNYLLGRALAGEVAALLPSASSPSVTNKALLSWEQCAQRLGFSEFDRQRIWAEMVQRLAQPPFVNQLGFSKSHAERQAKLHGMKSSLPTNALPVAMQMYDDALKARPADWMLRENFARVLQDGGQLALAEAEWRKVIELMPHYPAAYYSLANILDAQNRSAEALPLFRQAIRLRPESLEARNGLGLALSNVGQEAEAKRELEKALDFNPRFVEARINLGQLLARQKQTAAAMEEYVKVLAINSNSVPAHVNMGKLLSQAGKLTEAAQHYRSALRADPNHAVAHFNLGNVLMAQQDPGAAEEYAAAVRSDPGFTEARYNLALILAKAGRDSEALTHLREVVRLKPEFAEGHLNLGVALAKGGDMQVAVYHFREALRLDPANELAQKFLKQAEARQP